MTGYVFANSKEEAEELIYDKENIYDEDSETNDSDNYNYSDDEAEITLEREDVTPPYVNTNIHPNAGFNRVPAYFLEECNSI